MFLFTKNKVFGTNYNGNGILYLKKLQATWHEAQRTCKAIGTSLVAIEYDEKDSCIARLTRGNRSFDQTSQIESGYINFSRT
jgi:hypothetical protein